MNKTLMAGLAALILTGSAEAVTFETGLNGSPKKGFKPFVGVSQELFKKGKVKVSGRVEKQLGSDMALQAWGSYDLGSGTSVTLGGKEGIDEGSNPFNPGYFMPSAELSRKLGNFSVGVGGRVYFPKGKEYDIQATASGSYKFGPFGIKIIPVVPVTHPQDASAKLTASYDLR